MGQGPVAGWAGAWLGGREMAGRTSSGICSQGPLLFRPPRSGLVPCLGLAWEELRPHSPLARRRGAPRFLPGRETPLLTCACVVDLPACVVP